MLASQRLVGKVLAAIANPSGSADTNAGQGSRKVAVVGHDAGFFGAQLLLLYVARFIGRARPRGGYRAARGADRYARNSSGWGR